MSPYLQEKVAYSGQKEVYQEASDSLAMLAGLSVSGKQIERVCHHYGALCEAQSIEPVAASCTEADQCYAMVDGSMLLTKDKDVETGKLLWREMKLGRVFKFRDARRCIWWRRSISDMGGGILSSGFRNSTGMSSNKASTLGTPIAASIATRSSSVFGMYGDEKGSSATTTRSATGMRLSPAGCPTRRRRRV